MTEPSPEQLLAIEYEKLKEEQIARIGTRDNLIYAAVASVGAAVGFGAANEDARLVLLFLPVVTFALGWTYLSNDLKITTIGRYLGHIAEQQLGSAGFGWESHHVQLAGRTRRKRYQLLVDVSIFPGSGIISVAYAWSLGDLGATKVALMVAGLALSLLLAYEMVRASPLVNADGLN